MHKNQAGKHLNETKKALKIEGKDSINKLHKMHNIGKKKRKIDAAAKAANKIDFIKI